MAINIKFDNNFNAIEPSFVLATKSGKKLGVLPAYNIKIVDSIAKGDLLFAVNKYDNGKYFPLWDKLVDFRLVYCPEMDTWFEIYVDLSENNDTVKDVTCISLGEAELSQINLYGVEINTEADIARPDYKPTILFNETDKEASLLNRIMEKAPHYSIRHVDASIAKIQRTFTFDGISLHDTFQEIAKEIDCVVIIDSGSNEDGSICRAIDVYDLESCCRSCGHRGNFLHICPECGSNNIYNGYGEDTSVFICAENLADGITYTTNTDSVKNCFRLEGGDDLMTATIANCNPNGSGYIWYLSDAIREDMSEELRERLGSYDALYEEYQKRHIVSLDPTILGKYNALVHKYSAYQSGLMDLPSNIVGYPALMNAYYDAIDFHILLRDELMPSVETSETTAAKQAALLDSTALSPVAVSNLDTCSAATATNAVLAMAKIVVDKQYRVKANGGTLSGTLWTGSFTVTNFSNEEDTADTPTVRVTITDDYSQFVQQKMSKALSDSTDGNASSISKLFDMSLSGFKTAIKKYCLASLQSFTSACQSCLDIMIEQGIANNETWAEQSTNLYTTMYTPYYQKYNALQEEMILRESEIATIAGLYDAEGNLQEDGIQTLIQRENDTTHDALHFESYLGETLWKEFVAYRREDSYKNDNYISDGLSNSALISLALEFIEKAKEEIYKSATLQHSISSTLKNLLVMEDFKPIVKHFKVGNWIRLSVDGDVYRLRLLSYEISFEDLNSLSVVFSDVTKVFGKTDDAQSVLDQMASMASSYSGIMRQAEQASNGKYTLDSWVTDGLALTKMKIIDTAKDQNLMFDEHGLLCRQYLPITESYDDKQLKIINRGLYLTDDGWLTSRAGIGDFTYYNPETGKMEESYGVIADTLIGNLILSKKVGIFNMDNSIVLDQNGIVITTNGENVPGDQKVFTIRRKDVDENGVEILSNLFFVDNNGNLTFSGTLKGVDGDFTGDVTAVSLTIQDKPVDEYVDNRAEQITNPIRESLEDLIDTVDGEVVIYYETTCPTGVNNKDIWYNTNTNTIMRYVDGEWINITYTTLGLSLRSISDAQSTADGKIVTFAQTSAPRAAAVGDLWIDTDDKNKLYRWNGSAWAVVRDTAIGELELLVSELVDFQDGELTIHYTISQPQNPSKYDVWYNTSTGEVYRYDGSKWNSIANSELALLLKQVGDAQATADGKIETFAQAERPTAKSVGDLWIDTDDKNKLYRWNGSAWVEHRDQTIADAQEKAESAESKALSAQGVANAAQSSAGTALEAANTASTAAKGARDYANAIYNGTTGIFFQSAEVTSLTMNSTVGLKIVGKDNTYFQVKNNAMGFFRADDTAMLYYDQGDLVISGVISAHGGNIGGANGWIIGENQIAKADGTMGLRVNDATWGIWAGSGKFRVQPDGYLYAENATITGAITANSLTANNGTIAGFTITGNSLYCGGVLGASSTSTGISTDSTYAFWAGNGAFRVAQNGYLNAQSADIYGTLHAGSWTFDNSGAIYSVGGYYGRIYSNGYTMYYDTYGLDAQYGADSYHNTTLYGNYLKLVPSTNSYGIVICDSDTQNLGTIDYEDPTIICDGADNGDRDDDWDYSCGNIGTRYYRWDIAWIRYINYETLKPRSTRLAKHNIKTLGDMGDIIDALNPVSFVYNWHTDDQISYGLILEDTIDVLPYICFPDEKNPQYGGIDYTRLIPILLKEVQSLRARVKALEQYTR